MLAVWFGVSRVEDCLAVLAHNGVNFGLDFTIISTQLCPIGNPIKQEADDKHGGIGHETSSATADVKKVIR